MLFKGTKTRSAFELSQAVEKVGGALEAFTTKEQICLYAQVLEDYKGLASDVLSDMILNPSFPADQLVREHIAGDLLESPRVSEELGINESIIGTAFWRFGELGHDNCVEFPEIRFDALDNQIDTFAKAFQGLTISCARCHDHKLDAISSKDYYALVGVLESCSQVVHTVDSPQRIDEVKIWNRGDLDGQLLAFGPEDLD